MVDNRGVAERLASAVRRRLGEPASDAGFTLIETVVALAMASLLFTALAYAGIGALQATQIARENQQAIDLANARLEQVRNLAWGAMGHSPTGLVCPDPNLTDCGGSPGYGGEALVTVVGGLATQFQTETVNSVPYTIATYVTQPVDTSGNYRRVTVIVAWTEYGRNLVRLASTVVSESTKGLALPDFKLTAVGSSNYVVNPGASAYWGMKIVNQGAPERLNITDTGGFTPTYYRDNGDELYSPGDDITPLTDSTGDGKVDTGRLDPLQSIVIWAIYQVPGSAPVATMSIVITATSVGRPTVATASASLTMTLEVTNSVITTTPTATGSSTPTPTGTATPTICPDPAPAATPAPVAGYSLYSYTLHNSGGVSWPTLPLPATDPIPGSVALKPMTMNLTGPAIPAGRQLPVLSSDLTPADTAGRLLYTGGTFTSGASQVADYQSNAVAKTYTGSIVLRTYVDRVPGGTAPSVSLTAQMYAYRASGNRSDAILTAQTAVVSPYNCAGFQAVSFSFPISTPITLANNYVLSVRIWNSGTETVRLAYDHADYPTALIVVQQ